MTVPPACPRCNDNVNVRPVPGTGLWSCRWCAFIYWWASVLLAELERDLEAAA
jgi:hypothetical protein